MGLDALEISTKSSTEWKDMDPGFKQQFLDTATNNKESYHALKHAGGFNKSNKREIKPRKARLKDINRPKQPMNSFLLFCSLSVPKRSIPEYVNLSV